MRKKQYEKKCSVHFELSRCAKGADRENLPHFHYTVNQTKPRPPACASLFRAIANDLFYARREVIKKTLRRACNVCIGNAYGLRLAGLGHYRIGRLARLAFHWPGQYIEDSRASQGDFGLYRPAPLGVDCRAYTSGLPVLYI